MTSSPKTSNCPSFPFSAMPSCGVVHQWVYLFLAWYSWLFLILLLSMSMFIVNMLIYVYIILCSHLFVCNIYMCVCYTSTYIYIYVYYIIFFEHLNFKAYIHSLHTSTSFFANNPAQTTATTQPFLQPLCAKAAVPAVPSLMPKVISIQMDFTCCQKFKRNAGIP